MSLFHALSSYLSLEYRWSVVKASILEPGESKLFLERVQNKLTPLILGSKECRMKGRGSKGWKRVSRERRKNLDVKIKGGEFIFAQIATELRNCLTGKIAPAQANYIHLLDLLPPLLFLPPPSSTTSFSSPRCSLSLSLSLFERYHFPIPPSFSLISHRSRLSTLLAVDSRFFVWSPTTYLPLFDDPCFCGTRFSSDASLSALIVAN